MNEITLCWQELEEVHTFSITETQTISIGRDPSCDIVPADRKVSRRHASISGEAGVFWLRNLSQTNPIYVNEQQKLSRDQQVEVAPGSIFRIGSSWFTVQAEPVADHVVECSGCGQWVDRDWQTCKYCGMSLSGAHTVIDWENLD